MHIILVRCCVALCACTCFMCAEDPANQRAGLPLRFYSDYRLAEMDLYYSAEHESGGSHYADAKIELDTSLFHRVRVLGGNRDWMFQLQAATSSKDGSVTGSDSDIAGLVARRFGSIMWGLEIVTSQWSGRARLTDRVNNRELHTEFTSEYASIALIGMFDEHSDQGTYGGYRYSYYDLPAAIGYIDANHQARGVILDDDVRHHNLTFFIGHDFALDRTNTTFHLGFTGGAELSFGWTWLRPNGTGYIEQATGLDIDSATEHSFTFRGEAHVGILLHGRLPWSWLAHAGFQLEAGIMADGWIFLVGPSDDSELEPGELRGDYEGRFILYGTYLKATVMW